MRSLLIFCFLICLFKTLSAQENFASRNIGWSGGNIQLHTLRDASGDWHASILVSSDSFKVFLLNRTFDIVRTFALARLANEDLAGGFIREGKIYFFCDYHQPRAYNNYRIDTQTGEITNSLVLTDKEKDKLIDRASTGNYFLSFYIDKKNSNFIVYYWRSQLETDTLTYHFTDPVLWDNISKPSSTFTRDVDVAKIDAAGMPDVQAAGTKNKIYLVQDTLFLIMNRNLANTRVYMFDLKGKTASYTRTENETVAKVIDPITKQTRVVGGYSDNSFLLNGKLYFVSASEETLKVIISDFHTGKELQRFLVGKEDTINFKNTPIIQEGKAWYFNNTRELTKTTQVLRKMLNGTAVIAAVSDSLGIALTIGSNKEMQQMGSGAGFGYAGGAGTPMTIPTGGFVRSTWTKSVRFGMQLDSLNFQQIPGDMSASINDRVGQFTKDIKIPDRAEDLLFQEGQYIYIYYDKSKRSLEFTRFGM